MGHAIARAHLHTYLNLLRCAFYCMLKIDMNPSQQAVFRTPTLYS